MTTKERDAQWEELYSMLFDFLSRNGRSWVEPDDYLLVADDWGGWTQKLCMGNPNLPTEDIIKGIQGLLSGKFDRWNVMIIFEDGSSREGLRVFFDRVIRQSDDVEEL